MYGVGDGTLLPPPSATQMMVTESDNQRTMRTERQPKHKRRELQSKKRNRKAERTVDLVIEVVWIVRIEETSSHHRICMHKCEAKEGHGERKTNTETPKRQAEHVSTRRSYGAQTKQQHKDSVTNTTKHYDRHKHKTYCCSFGCSTCSKLLLF